MKNLFIIMSTIFICNFSFAKECRTVKNKNNICSKTFSHDRFSAEFESTEDLREKIILSGYEINSGDLEKSSKTINCTKNSIVKAITCINKSYITSKNSVTQNYIEDLF